ncbi:MAG: hypothetical protein MJD61_03770 [Proteobacteria bacterium]|nr:hypothetical protein [Pseudomonadota bacterium]
MRGVTFDTGALIGLERRTGRMVHVLAAINRHRLPVTIPSVVVAEWYRQQHDAEKILGLAVRIEPLSGALSRVAGKALRMVGGRNTIDAIVMSSAAQRGDAVYTSDVDDLSSFAQAFPDVRVSWV